MKICKNKHVEIVFDNSFSEICPLCNLTEHNNTVHDFIESQGKDLVKKLVEYQRINACLE